MKNRRLPKRISVNKLINPNTPFCHQLVKNKSNSKIRFCAKAVPKFCGAVVSPELIRCKEHGGCGRGSVLTIDSRRYEALQHPITSEEVKFKISDSD